MIKPIACKFNHHDYIYCRNNKESFIQYRVCRDCGKLQERYYELLNNNELDDILDKGMKKTNEIAKTKYEELKDAVGLHR